MEELANQISENIQVAPEVAENHEAKSQESKPVDQGVVLEDPQERNWKAFREKQRELERELRMQREMNERLLQMTSQAPSKQEVDELEGVNDEEFIPLGKQKKLVRKEVQPLLREIDELKKQVNQQQQVQFLDNLRRQYSDFDDVVNAETLALLENKDPELAQTIADQKDPYKIGVQSYKYIKAMNLTAKAPEARRAKEVEKKLENNAKTVQTPQAYDKRPMAQAFKMTDAEKKQLYQEMHQYASLASSVPEIQ